MLLFSFDFTDAEKYLQPIQLLRMMAPLSQNISFLKRYLKLIVYKCIYNGIQKAEKIYCRSIALFLRYNHLKIATKIFF